MFLPPPQIPHYAGLAGADAGEKIVEEGEEFSHRRMSCLNLSSAILQ